jgi:hypothetical protein
MTRPEDELRVISQIENTLREHLTEEQLSDGECRELAEAIFDALVTP